MDGYLDAKVRQKLRAISSRADISATSFQVYYTYSDLKAEPSELMLKYFDIGFYYADWGSIDAYIKLPAGTIPSAMLEFATLELSIHQTDEWQLLVFSIEEYYEYFDDESADDFFQHLAALRSELMQGDWRLFYFIWLKTFGFNDELEGIPLIQFDFTSLSEGLLAFTALYDIPLASIKALAMVLSAQPSHQALAMTRKESVNKDETYQYWLTPDVITPYIQEVRSQLQQEQAEELAKKLAIERAEKEKVLADIYSQREHCWLQAQEQANRICASGYDAASRYLHQLFEAYQFKGDVAAFEHRFKRFTVANNNRKALLNRLSDLL
nr:hypothetical protein [Pectobacterium brasiliense]